MNWTWILLKTNDSLISYFSYSPVVCNPYNLPFREMRDEGFRSPSDDCEYVSLSWASPAYFLGPEMQNTRRKIISEF